MKRLLIILGLFLTMGLSIPLTAQNISVNVNLNLNKQPAWGPVGYDYAEFYYFPDLNIYYDVANSLFYYLSGGNWIYNQYLPDKYKKYDLYGLYKIVINERQPWLQNKTHKKSYSQYKGDKTQTPIRYAENTKYSESKKNDRIWIDRTTNVSQSNNKGDNQVNNQNNKKSPDNKSTSNQGKGTNSDSKKAPNQQGGRK